MRLVDRLGIRAKAAAPWSPSPSSSAATDSSTVGRSYSSGGRGGSPSTGINAAALAPGGAASGSALVLTRTRLSAAGEEARRPRILAKMSMQGTHCGLMDVTRTVRYEGHYKE
jgi:hypothetical protein